MKQLQDYQSLLATTGVEWGLIGPREADRLWDRHIDNCLAVTEDEGLLPRDTSVIDVGTGAGLPGLVWAISRPDLRVTLVEPLERRVKFLELAVQHLELTSVSIVRGRAQDVHARADVVTARAVSSLKNLLPWLSPLVSDPGRMVLMKGRKAEQEVDDSQGWLRKHQWRADVRDVGHPARTRVVVVERGVQR